MLKDYKQKLKPIYYKTTINIKKTHQRNKNNEKNTKKH